MKNTLVKNSTFQNFDFIYSAIYIEMKNVTLSFNIFQIKGTSSFMITEKLFYANNIKVINNVGKNITLIRGFGEYIGLNCLY